MAFTIDPTAPTMPDDYELRTFDEVEHIMVGAQDISESLQDNDSEIWKLTKAGQFVRITGVDSDRYYVVPPMEARAYLDGYVDDKVMSELREAGAFDKIAPMATP